MKNLIYSNRASFGLKVNRKGFYLLFDSILKIAGYKLKNNEEISINFVSKKEIAVINDKFVHHTGPTDVITFDLRNSSYEIDDPSSKNIAAEIFICPEIAFIESNERNINFSEEITLYIVHAILHLSGYDDIKISDSKKMREAEKRVMSNISISHNLEKLFTLSLIS